MIVPADRTLTHTGLGAELAAGGTGQVAALGIANADARFSAQVVGVTLFGTLGDEIATLVDIKGWLVTDLAQTFNRKRNRLSEICHTSQAFGADLRDGSIPFSRYELARIGVAKFGHSPKKALKLIMNKGINQRRDAMRYFASLDRAKRNRKSALKAGNQSHSQAIINQCHNRFTRQKEDEHISSSSCLHLR